MRKGYKLTDERRKTLLAQGHYGFSHEGSRESPEWDRGFNAQYVRDQGEGNPGLSITHQFDNDHCPKRGIGCTNGYHRAIYRDRKGTPVAFATHSKFHPEDKPRVGLLYADRTRGITHALAVGHIANHLNQVGAIPSNSLSHHSQTLTSHGFEMKDQGRDEKIKQYLDKRNARIAKGYQMSEFRRQRLARRYEGFDRRAPDDPTGRDARDWHPTIRSQGQGEPGLTITHNYGDKCEDRGVGCVEQRHVLVHRDSAGAPIAYAKVDPDHYDDHGGKPYVSMLASDRTRGLAHVLAVGHIARHLDKMGVEPSTDLSTYSQKFISHGLEMKEAGKDARLKNYLAARAARVQKGYEMTPESAHRARAATGAAHSDMYEPDEWARDELTRVPKGKPGLSIHRHKQSTGGGWDEPGWNHNPGLHTIVYRDHTGNAVSAAEVRTTEPKYKYTYDPVVRHNTLRLTGLARPEHGRHVQQMISDRSRGAIHALGTAHVGGVLNRLNIKRTQEMTDHSQRMVAHSLENPEKTKKILDYVARRAKRGN